MSETGLVGLTVELIGISLMWAAIIIGPPQIVWTAGFGLWVIGFLLWGVERYA